MTRSLGYTRCNCNKLYSCERGRMSVEPPPVHFWSRCDDSDSRSGGSRLFPNENFFRRYIHSSPHAHLQAPINMTMLSSLKRPLPTQYTVAHYTSALLNHRLICSPVFILQLSGAAPGGTLQQLSSLVCSTFNYLFRQSLSSLSKHNLSHRERLQKTAWKDPGKKLTAMIFSSCFLLFALR